MSDREGKGGPIPRSTDDEILAVFWEVGEPVLTVRELSEHLPLERRQVQNRLEALEAEGRVQRKTLQGKYAPTVWWPADMGLPLEDSPSPESDYRIGIEPVDALDLDGRKVTLQSRRYAVNAVFAFLFLQKQAEPAVLKKLAWATEPNKTYQSPGSLWNNCIEKALSGAPFLFKQSDSGWELTALAQSLSEQADDLLLWNDWEQNKQSYIESIFRVFWQQYDDYLTPREFQFAHTGDPSKIVIELSDIDVPIVCIIAPDSMFWTKGIGTLQCQVPLSNEAEGFEALAANRETVNTDLHKIDSPPTPVIQWNQVEGNSSETTIIAVMREITIDASRVDLSNPNSHLTFPPIQHPQWLEEVIEQLHDILARYIY